jgi:hypothetical protein
LPPFRGVGGELTESHTGIYNVFFKGSFIFIAISTMDITANTPQNP